MTFAVSTPTAVGLGSGLIVVDGRPLNRNGGQFRSSHRGSEAAVDWVLLIDRVVATPTLVE